MCDHIRCEAHGGFLRELQGLDSMLHCTWGIRNLAREKTPNFGRPHCIVWKKLLLLSNAKKWKTEQEEMKKRWKSKIACWCYKVMGGLKVYSDMPKPCNQSAKRLKGRDTRAYCASQWHHSWVRGKGDREIPSFPSGVKKAKVDIDCHVAMWEDCTEGLPALAPSIAIRAEMSAYIFI